MTVHDYSTGEMPRPDEPQWDTKQLQVDFEVLAFAAPFVVVRRRSDGVKGTLQFNHRPRIYWGFSPS
jgi:hypothetical protein